MLVWFLKYSESLTEWVWVSLKKVRELPICPIDDSLLAWSHSVHSCVRFRSPANAFLRVAVSIPLLGKALTAKNADEWSQTWVQLQMILEVALLCKFLLAGEAMEKLVLSSWHLVDHNGFLVAFILENFACFFLFEAFFVVEKALIFFLPDQLFFKF